MSQLRNKRSGEFLAWSGKWRTYIGCRCSVTALLCRGKEVAVVQGLAWRQLPLQPVGSAGSAAWYRGVHQRCSGSLAMEPDPWEDGQTLQGTGRESRGDVAGLCLVWARVAGGHVRRRLACRKGSAGWVREYAWAPGFWVWGIEVGLLRGIWSLLAVKL